MKRYKICPKIPACIEYINCSVYIWTKKVSANHFLFPVQPGPGGWVDLHPINRPNYFLGLSFFFAVRSEMNSQSNPSIIEKKKFNSNFAPHSQQNMWSTLALFFPSLFLCLYTPSTTIFCWHWCLICS